MRENKIRKKRGKKRHRAEREIERGRQKERKVSRLSVTNMRWTGAAVINTRSSPGPVES